jgi:Mg-chelatase subunit ChlD
VTLIQPKVTTPRPAPRAHIPTMGGHSFMAAAARTAARAQGIQDRFERGGTIAGGPNAVPEVPTEGQLLSRLGFLAQALTGSTRIAVEAGKKWALDDGARKLTLPVEALQKRGMDASLGALCREVGHMKYRGTRTPETQTPVLRFLTRVVDDVRASKMMAARYAGAAPYLKAHFAKHFDPVFAPTEPLTRMQQLATAMVHEGLTDGAPSPLVDDPDVLRMLTSLRGAIDEATRLPPGANLRFGEPSVDVLDAEAQASLEVVRTRLLPMAERLFALDVADRDPDDDAANGPANGKRPAGGDDDFDDVQEPGESGGRDDAGEQDASQSSSASAAARSEAEAGLEAEGAAHEPELGDDAQPPSDDEPQKNQGKGDPSPGGRRMQGKGSEDISLDDQLDAFARAQAQPAEVLAAETAYRALCKRNASAIDQMKTELGAALARTKRTKLVGHFKSGRLDMRRMVRNELARLATGATDPRVCLRRAEPDQHSMALVFCVDMSGSMAGEPEKAARDGCVVLAEAFGALGVPFSVVMMSGTDEGAQVVLSMDDNDERARALALHKLHADGGNNELAALRLARDMLADVDAAQKQILMLTDGMAVSGTTEYVKRTVDEDGVGIVGIGIGLESSDVETVYPRHVKVAAVDTLASTLAKIINDSLDG